MSKRQRTNDGGSSKSTKTSDEAPPETDETVACVGNKRKVAATTATVADASQTKSTESDTSKESKQNPDVSHIASVKKKKKKKTANKKPGCDHVHDYASDDEDIVRCGYCRKRCCPECRQGVQDSDDEFCDDCAEDLPHCAADGEAYKYDHDDFVECIFCEARMCKQHALKTADSFSSKSVYCANDCAMLTRYVNSHRCDECKRVFAQELDETIEQGRRVVRCTTCKNSPPTEAQVLLKKLKPVHNKRVAAAAAAAPAAAAE